MLQTLPPHLRNLSSLDNKPERSEKTKGIATYLLLHSSLSNSDGFLFFFSSADKRKDHICSIFPWSFLAVIDPMTLIFPNLGKIEMTALKEHFSTLAASNKHIAEFQNTFYKGNMLSNRVSKCMVLNFLSFPSCLFIQEQSNTISEQRSPWKRPHDYMWILFHPQYNFILASTLGYRDRPK